MILLRATTNIATAARPAVHHQKRATAATILVKRSAFATYVPVNAATNQAKTKRGFFAWYTRMIDTYPLLTKCLTAALVSGVGDITSQALQKHHKESSSSNDDDGGRGDNNNNKSFSAWLSSLLEDVDLAQTGRFVLMNLAFVGPTLHYWYIWLGRRFPGTHARGVATRVFMDEFVFTPFYYPIFLGILWKLEHGKNISTDQMTSMLVREMPSLLLGEWLIYVPAQAINFKYVPVKFQVLYCNLVGVGWNAFLSWKANSAHANHHNATNTTTTATVTTTVETPPSISPSIVSNETNKPDDVHETTTASPGASLFLATTASVEAPDNPK